MESFAHWIGISVKHAPFLGIEDTGLGEFVRDVSANTHFAIDVDRLNTRANVLDLKSRIIQYGANLLVLNCQGDAQQARALYKLTNGCIANIAPPEPINGEIILEPAISSASPLLAGLSFKQTRISPLASFVLAKDNCEAEVLVSVESRPLLIRIPWGSGSLFCSTVQLPDLSEHLSLENPLKNHILSLIPPLLFMRSSFADQCWHPDANTAQLLLDDPPLVHNYGYLDFNQLVDSMQRAHYATTLAFIPWNYWRTTKSAVRRWLSPSSGLSICVHGCDHTRREFADRGSDRLYAKAQRALNRMQKQRTRTGAGFDPVMVFPQGYFSSVALVALRQAGYLAAVNTSILATDREDILTLGDALMPARMHPCGFPLFQRHAPQQIFDFFFALFLGKPALAVRHPIDFRNGYADLESFFMQMQKRVPSLTWQPLSEQFTWCSLHRTLDDGTHAIRFFTRKYQFARDNSSSSLVQLCKYEPNPSVVDRVLLDGKPIEYDYVMDDLSVITKIDDSCVHTIEIIDKLYPHALPLRDDALYASQVLIRRILSEVRDRKLCKYKRLLDATQRAVRKARLSANL
jgi:hypothetical protein